MEFELVLPCYNEEKSLEYLIDRAKEAAQKKNLTPSQFQLVLVENGSKDQSRAKMMSLKNDPQRAPWFRPVFVDQNQGYGYGLWQGLKATSSSYVGWSHADQQCDPSDAIRAWEEAKSDLQRKTLVKGVRVQRNWKDRFVSRTFELFATVILGKRFYEINAQPKVFPSELLQEVKNPPKDFSFDLYVLYCAFKKGYGLKTFEVEFPPRIHGVSNWSAHFFSRYKTILKIIRYMFQLATSEGRL